ncbi:uncharacterized protein L201_007675 [Kwoniella dendrophila CBS 6074]|uniref:Uncharacterized protein n=1 Tax=Kwoniella dendrophila CBS 6074 TaxID=1295534 RepID=A0AAX4K4R4_9TREE
MASRVTYRTSARSGQSIIVVLFLLILAYVFFSGSKKKKGSKSSREDNGAESNRRGSKDPKSSSDEEREERRKRRKEREGRKKNGSGSGSDSGSGSESDRRQKKKDDKKDRKKQKKSKEPIEWEKPIDGKSPPLSSIPNHRTATPSKSAFRKRDTNDNLPPTPNTSNNERIKWIDQQKNGSTSPVNKHFRKWNDYLGLTDDSNKGIYEDLPKNKTPEQSELKSKKIQQHPSIRFSFDNISKRVQEGRLDLSKDVLRLMQKIEQISKAKPTDEKLWLIALQDSWNSNLGNLPKIIMTLCIELSKLINKKDIHNLSTKMKKRKKIQLDVDIKRDFTKFVSTLNTDMNSPEFPLMLLIGWYLDTYRSKKSLKRMQIDNKSLNMTEKEQNENEDTSKISFILGFLENLAELNKSQRLFIGLDLFGLTIRAQAVKEKSSSGTDSNYRLDLTIFLPCSDEKLENPLEWIKRFIESCESFRHFHVALIQSLNNTSDDIVSGDIFKRRRLIFRPGWTIKGVNQSQLNDQENINDKSIAQRVLLERKSKIIELPDDSEIQDSSNLKKIFKYLTNKEIQKCLSRLSPGEILFKDLRQFQWDKSTLTPFNNTLTSINFWLGYKIVGDRLQFKLIENTKDQLYLNQPRTMFDFIRSIDLGNYLPLHQTQPNPTFLKINDFPALELLVLSYLPSSSNQNDLSTISLILDPKFGLRKELENEKEPTQHFIKHTIKLKLFISIPSMQLIENVQSDLNHFFTNKLRELLNQGMNKSRIRDMINNDVSKILDNVFIVDESSSGNDGLPRGIKLDYRFDFPPELMEDGVPNQTRTSNTRSSSNTPTGNPTNINQSPTDTMESRPSPFLSPRTPMTPPSPHTNPQVRLTDPRRAEQAAIEAQRRAQESLNSQSPRSPSSNYRPPSVEDAENQDDESPPSTTGRFANLNTSKVDGKMSKGGSGEKGPETMI